MVSVNTDTMAIMSGAGEIFLLALFCMLQLLFLGKQVKYLTSSCFHEKGKGWGGREKKKNKHN